MAIYIPFVRGMLREETEEWYGSRTDVRLWGLDVEDMTAYWKFLNCVWWSDRDDTVIVEHDMVPGEGVVDRMLACDQPWCTSPYSIGPRVTTSALGCTKFSLSLKRTHPDLMRVVGGISDALPAKDWRRLDVRIATELRRRGFSPHTHEASRHLHYEVKEL